MSVAMDLRPATGTGPAPVPAMVIAGARSAADEARIALAAEHPVGWAEGR